MNISLGRVILLVKDYEEAFTFYQQTFHCQALFDYTDENGQRYLHIGFGLNDKTGIWLLKADSEEQLAKVGKQTTPQPTFVLYTDSFDQLHQHLITQKVEIIRPPEKTPNGQFLHFLDLYGNEIILAEQPS